MKYLVYGNFYVSTFPFISFWNSTFDQYFAHAYLVLLLYVSKIALWASKDDDEVIRQYLNGMNEIVKGDPNEFINHKKGTLLLKLEVS